MAVTLQHLKSQRKEKGFTQESLAQLAGISTRTIQRLERGEEASFETAKALASVLECDSYHALCAPETPQPDTPEEKDKETPETELLMSKLRSLEMGAGLPASDDCIRKGMDAQARVNKHFITGLQQATSGNALGVISSLGLSLLISLGLSVAFELSEVAGFIVVFILFPVFIFGPQSITTEALAEAHEEASRIHAWRLNHLSTEAVIEKRGRLTDLIEQAKAGDTDAMYAVGKAIYGGGKLLPGNAKKGLAIFSIASDLGNRAAAEKLLEHFRIESAGDGVCRDTGIDAKQAAYEAALHAKALGSRKGAEYIAKIDNPPQKRGGVGLGTILVGAALGIAILS